MKELETIQQDNKLNDIFATDDVGPGGVHHRYSVCPHGQVYIDSFDACLSTAPDYNGENPFGIEIHFQEGPRNDPACVRGVLDCDLLEIVRDRLADFQNGSYCCKETALALANVENALRLVNNRQLARAERGVLGTDMV